MQTGLSPQTGSFNNQKLFLDSFNNGSVAAGPTLLGGRSKVERPSLNVQSRKDLTVNG